MQVVMWTNIMRFDQPEYSDDIPIINESQITFFDVPHLQEIRLFAVKESILNLEDNLLMEIESVTGKDGKFFELIPQPTRSRSSPNPRYFTKLILGFEIDQNVTQIERSVYNTFMLLGDVGGFQGLLFSIGAFIVSIFTFKNSENYLAKKLYEPSASHEDSNGQSDTETKKKELDARDQYAFKEYM